MRGVGRLVLLLSVVARLDGVALRSRAAGGRRPGRVHEDGRLAAELEREATAGLLVEVTSSADSCRVRADGRLLLDQTKPRSSDGVGPSAWRLDMNGMYALSLNTRTGRATGRTFAAGHAPGGAFRALEAFLVGVRPGRAVVLCVLAEAALSLDQHGEALFHALNSSFAPDLQTRSVFALVAVKGGAVLGEGYVPNLRALAAGEPPHPTLRLAVTVTASERTDCGRTSDAADLRRRYFCQRYDGYGALCDCDAPALPAPPRPFADGTRFPYPVIVLASDRPRYLYRCLGSLLPNRGLDPAKVVVFSDGEHREVQELLRLLNVTSHTHFAEPAGAALRDAASRIGSAYRYTIQKAFELFPSADKLVLLEEDLEVSSDFVSFFQQTHRLLDDDVSLYCISAWNDHGYRHTVGDAALLYRVGFMPGLGWMLTRRLFFDELLPSWPAPGADFDWDVLVRHAVRRRGRDCVVPDVPRTYHFGFQGGHVGSAMQYKYYWDHALNQQPDVRLKDVERMVLPRYTAQLMELLRSATKLDGSQSRLTCTDMIPSNATNQTYVLFVRMTSAADTAGWEKVATCLNLWDLDVRGDHHGVWRFFYNGHHVLVMGVPFSALAGYALNHGPGRMLLFTGRRSERERRRGRWPPGLSRPRPADRAARYRLAAAAAGLHPGQLGDGGFDAAQPDDDEEEEDDEDDERLQDISSA